MANLIYINGDNSTQPSKVKEELKQAVHDRVSIKGTYTRVWIAQKRIVTLTFTAISQTQYSTLNGYFTGSAKPVSYYNADSGISFNGFPTIAEAEYYQGASLLKDYTVTIQEK